MRSPRSQFVIATLDDTTAPRITGLNEQFIISAFGITATGPGALDVLDDVVLAKVGASGQLETFTQSASSNSDRFGSVNFMTNNFLFYVGGRARLDSTNEMTKGRTIQVCPTRTNCTTEPLDVGFYGGDSGVTMQDARYRAAGVYANGFFYFLGGANWDGGTGENVAIDSVERGGYAQ